MLFGNKVAHCRGVPVITPRHSATVVQSLLHDAPLSLLCKDEAVQVDLKPVGDRVIVDTCGQSTGADQTFAVKSMSFGERAQFIRSVTRETTAATADVDA